MLPFVEVMKYKPLPHERDRSITPTTILTHTTTMPATAPFNPPAIDLAGKPVVPVWNAPPITQEKHNFAQLKSIDLSLLDSEDPAVVDGLVQTVKVAIRDDGFLFLEDYGVSLEQVSFLQIQRLETHP
jgi:hypothetical protein